MFGSTSCPILIQGMRLWMIELFLFCRVMRNLKDYAVQATANAVDHLGSVSYKVDNLLNYEVDEVSAATFEVSCMKQVSFSKLSSRILMYELIT